MFFSKLSTVSFIILQRSLQAILGLFTLILLAHFLTPIQQGWYYSFISLSSFYAIFDLGLSALLLQLSSHYFMGNKWGPNGMVIGNTKDHFISLLSQSLRFYLKLGVGFCLFIAPAGLVFFGLKSHQIAEIDDWQLIWIVLVFATTLNIFLLPFLSMVEGSGSIKEIYIVRIIQCLLSSLTCWIFLIYGGILWAAAISPFVGFLVGISWLLYKKPILPLDAWNCNQPKINWSIEVWPLQWRYGLSWLSGYLLTQIYTPILFYYDGPEVAGQMGLSLTLANMLGLISQSWIARRLPSMTKAVGEKDWYFFDQIFKRDFIVSIIFYLLGMIAFCSLYYLAVDTKYIKRILNFWPFIGLFLVVLVNHVNGALASHLRSYRKEPLVWVALAGTILTVPIAVVSASYYSVSGVINSILLVQLLLTLPLSVHLWAKYNKAWRQ